MQDMVEIDAVTGEPVMSRALKRHLSMRPGQRAGDNPAAGPETVSDGDAAGGDASDSSLSDSELQALEVEPDAAASAALEEQRRAGVEAPMASIVDWVTILRMKQMGRQRRMQRRRAAARSEHEQALQDYLQQYVAPGWVGAWAALPPLQYNRVGGCMCVRHARQYVPSRCSPHTHTQAQHVGCQPTAAP